MDTFSLNNGQTQPHAGNLEVSSHLSQKGATHHPTTAQPRSQIRQLTCYCLDRQWGNDCQRSVPGDEYHGGEYRNDGHDYSENSNDKFLIDFFHGFSPHYPLQTGIKGALRSDIFYPFGRQYDNASISVRDRVVTLLKYGQRYGWGSPARHYSNPNARAAAYACSN